MKVKIVIPALLGVALVFLLAGCTTKNYVRNQTAPLADRANQLDARSADNSRNLSDLDRRNQAGIAGAQASADAAGQHAGQAQDAATQAQAAADASAQKVAALGNTIANLDGYRTVSTQQVLFATGSGVLTSTDKHKLDALGAQLASTPHYMLEIKGATDSTGSAELNNALSEKRAESVVHYLAAKYNVPARSISLIGVGKDAEVASNRSVAGRAKNRRVEVRLLVRADSNTVPAAG